MLRASIIFFILAIVSMLLGLNGIAGLSIEIGKILLIVFLVLSVLSFLFGRSRGKNSSLVMVMAFILIAGTFGTSAWAGPMPDAYQPQQQECPGSCQSPQPQFFTCHAKMVDCYGRTLYTFWGRSLNYQEACGFAVNHCANDARLGYGGAGARCIILGK